MTPTHLSAPVLPTGRPAAAPPAGGAAFDEIAIVAGVVAAGMLTLGWAGLRTRTGQATVLGWVADIAARRTDLPRWAALPLLVHFAALVTVYVGFMWDASLHLDNGRDEGPLANPSHYPMMIGLFGVLIAGLLGVVLTKPGERPSAAAVKIAPNWYVPLGSFLVVVAGLVDFSGFPLDDIWHRLFGQDVTLWGPTHLLMLGGAVLSIIGFAVLFEEATRDRTDWAPLPSLLSVLYRNERSARLPRWVVRIVITTMLLIAFSAFLTEFDYGVPMYQLLFQPLLVAFGAGFVLVAARLWIGAGAALITALLYVIVRVAIASLVGDVFGQTRPTFPLMLAEAWLVEAAGFFLLTRRRPVLAFGVVAGLLIGTVGFATEWWWSQGSMQIAWTEPLLPEGLISAIVAGLAGGVSGALLAAGLTRSMPRPPLARGLGVAALVALSAVMANGLILKPVEGATADVSLQDVAATPQRQVLATVRFTPRDLADGATWVRAIAWQGDAPLVSFEMDRVAQGVYRTPRPVTVDGEWKTGVRVANGRAMQAVILYAPEDTAIPVGKIPADAEFTRPMITEREFLLREMKLGVPAWLWASGMSVVGAIALAFFLTLGWGVGRYGYAAETANGPSPPTLTPLPDMTELIHAREAVRS